MKFVIKLLFILFFVVHFSSFGQKLQLQKNLESVSKVIQSPNGDYLLANEMTNYIAQKHGLLIHKRYKYYYRLHAKFSQKPILFLFKLIIKKYIKK